MKNMTNHLAYSKITHTVVVMEAMASNYADVLSGVPQGTVLGPVMFLLMILVIVYHYADGCIVYRVINLEEDHQQLMT